MPKYNGYVKFRAIRCVRNIKANSKKEAEKAAETSAENFIRDLQWVHYTERDVEIEA